MYAILDIETTGGKFNEEGVTEIAIYRFDGHEIVDQFISLINPERPIQEFVVKLTGINDKMVANAPKFYEAAKRIIEITKDAVLVAHNTSFDYRILRTEYRRLGFEFDRNTLCTVEFSKQLIPNQDSYSLGKLCKSIGIPLTDRHRANGDAVATVKLFKLLLEKDTTKKILEQTTKYSDNRNVKKKQENILSDLPENGGVFYVHNKESSIIFIGKGKNIRSEVTKIFLKDTKRALNVKKRMHSVTYELTGNNLFTNIKYYIELHTIKPQFNIVKKIKPFLKSFGNDDFIIMDKGRIPEENAVILIENNEVYGFGYTNLAYQENQLDILKSILTPIEHKSLIKKIVKTHLETKKVKKIIRL